MKRIQRESTAALRDRTTLREQIKQLERQLHVRTSSTMLVDLVYLTRL